LQNDCRNSTSTGTYEVGDNLVFVTLRAPLSQLGSAESFNISFSSAKSTNASDIYENHTFSHYHFSSEIGSLSYKELTGRDEYLPNEIMTIAVSNQNYQTFTVESVDTENSRDCHLDSLTRLYLSPDKHFYNRCGTTNQDHR